MATADKVKIVVDNALRKVGEYSEKASERATGLAEDAAKKAGEFTEIAREKAPAYLDRAAEIAGKAADVTAERVDKATGGRYHDKIDSVHGKLDETFHRVRQAPAPGSEATPEPDGGPTTTGPSTSGPTGAATDESGQATGGTQGSDRRQTDEI